VCVIRFADENVGRIAPTNLIKYKDKPFLPATVKDLPEDKVQVKWQQSTYGSFSSDGYFPAEVLAIAGEFASILNYLS